MLMIKFGTFPGSVTEYTISNGSTVRQALAQASITAAADSEIRVNGSVASLDRSLINGDIVLVAAKIKGN